MTTNIGYRHLIRFCPYRAYKLNEASLFLSQITNKPVSPSFLNQSALDCIPLLTTVSIKIDFSKKRNRWGPMYKWQ